MSLFQSNRERSESGGDQHSDAGGLSVTVTGDRSADGRRSSGADRSFTDSRLFALGRGLFGALLAFMAVDNLRNLDERVAYAEAKGAPMPSLSVPAMSSSLLVGSVGLALWRAPVAAASAVVAFLVGATPVMHDFWTMDDAEQRQQEQIHFLKNTAMLAGTLAFLGLGRQEDSTGRSREEHER